ncbi:unnamed protein product [Rotaria sordida]|uniref:Uncharacterized protein n=1 Tax=Rotaria sordida TaxID=392033 RepID=A0A814L930_9BILA|nr:unnamed protein product [Rotaria sordida]
MDERNKIIITVVFSIIGFILIIVIFCFIIWFILRRKSNLINRNKNPSILRRQQYERSHNVFINKYNSNKQKKRKRRFNTNDSSISLSFDSPHLINQNVRNLDKLLHLESLLTTNIWHYENTLSTTRTNHFDRCYTNPTTEPIYMSSSSSSVLSTPIPNPITDIQSYQQLNALNFRILNELNHGLSLKHEQRSTNPLRYSQSCRQTNDPLPFDYCRSITPPSIITINENPLETNHNRINKYSNTTLMRKAYRGQFRDDTAILY